MKGCNYRAPWDPDHERSNGPDRAFEAWMADVDAALVALCGLTSDDLPDYCYRDEYDADADAQDAATEAYKAAL